MQRNRNHRLLTAVLDNPTQVGVGISESTILVLRGKAAEVWGKGPVHIYDARAAHTEISDDHLSGRNLNLSLLQVGERFYF
jgi:cyanophycinase